VEAGSNTAGSAGPVQQAAARSVCVQYLGTENPSVFLKVARVSLSHVAGKLDDQPMGLELPGREFLTLRVHEDAFVHGEALPVLIEHSTVAVQGEQP